MSILNKSFYNQPTIEVAKQLLGKLLCRETNGKLYVGKIVETEAYLGKKDLACHSAKGFSERNKIMFGPAGNAYVYFIYGMYYCFNVVTEKENNPCAVLVRALEPLKVPRRNINENRNMLNGPAKLCREFRIDKKLNGWNLTLGKKLWIENGEIIKPTQIKKSKRIGVDYAGIWKDRLLRFYIKDSKFLSKK
jgi:DNA-3-methyladenine glycosylase